MATPRFDNYSSLKRWLDGQPRPVCVAIAARSAMRAVMIGAPTLNARDANHRAAILLHIFRAMATPWVTAKYPIQGAELADAATAAARTETADRAADAAVPSAARATVTTAITASRTVTAARAADAAVTTADRAAAATITTAGRASATAAHAVAAARAAYAPYADASIWREVSKDADFIESFARDGNAAIALCDQRLWWAPDGKMSASWNAFAEEISDMKRIRGPHTGFERIVAKDPEDRLIDEHWDVWTDWIADRCKGAPAIEALEVERALIPNDDWKKGQRHVNGLIKRMIERHQADALRNAAKQPETITRDPATGLHSVLPETVVDPRRYENALNKVADTIQRIRTARERPGNDMYGELEIIFGGLDIAYANYRAEPMRMHDEFIKAQKRLLRKCETGAVLADDELIEDLIDDLNNGHIDIRTSDDGVKDAVLSRSTAKKRGLSGVEEQDLDLATEAKALVSDASLARQLREDRDVIVALDENGEHPEDPTPEDAAYRLASRLPRIDEKSVDKVVGAADKMAKLNKGGEAGYSWLRFFLDWFG